MGQSVAVLGGATQGIDEHVGQGKEPVIGEEHPWPPHPVFAFLNPTAPHESPRRQGYEPQSLVWKPLGLGTLPVGPGTVGLRHPRRHDEKAPRSETDDVVGYPVVRFPLQQASQYGKSQDLESFGPAVAGVQVAPA